MDKKYYRAPLDFSSIFTSGTLAVGTCSERESIDQNIELLLSTYPGEHRFNKNWGCRIWEMDFVNVNVRKQWEDEFKGHIRNSIEQFEKRLSSLAIEIHISEVSQHDEILNTTAIKKRVTVYVNGNLVSTREKCGFRYIIYLGPLSAE